MRTCNEISGQLNFIAHKDDEAHSEMRFKSTLKLLKKLQVKKCEYFLAAKPFNALSSVKIYEGRKSKVYSKLPVSTSSFSN